MDAPVEQSQAARTAMDASQEPSPGLFVRKRGARRSRRENVGGQLFAIDGRHSQARRHFPRHLGEVSPRQGYVALRIVRETERIRRKHGELAVYFGSVS